MIRCHSAPANLVLMTHRLRTTTPTIAMFDGGGGVDPTVSNEPIVEHMTITTTDVDTIERTVTNATLHTGRSAPMYEIVQCLVTDECNVDGIEDAQLWVFLLNAMYDVWTIRLHLVLEEVLPRILSRFALTYGMHCVVNSANRVLMDHIKLH